MSEATAVLDRPDQAAEEDNVDPEDDDIDDDDDEVLDEDSEEDAGDDESADDADDASDDGGDGGSGDVKDDASVASAVKPTGRELLELLAGDPDAQQLMASTLEEIMAENAKSAAAQQEADEIQELIKSGNHAELGRRVAERLQNQQVRQRVADDVLQETFRPVYADLFAQPELQNLSAEDKETLDPKKFASDAHYVRSLTEFIGAKRHEAAIEAEVQKRVAAALEAASNRETAGRVKRKSVGASPGGTEGSGPARTSRELLHHGLRAVFEPMVGDEDDED